MPVNLESCAVNSMGGVGCYGLVSASPVAVSVGNQIPSGKTIVSVMFNDESEVTGIAAADGYRLLGTHTGTYPAGMKLTMRLSSITLSGWATIYYGD